VKQSFYSCVLVVVLVVLVAPAGIVVPMVSTTSSDAQLTTTKVMLQRLQDVIMNRSGRAWIEC